jgi:hypothetical protein
MINNEQRQRRANGIFASDVARIMTGEGVRVTLEKMGEVEPADLDGVLSVELGNILEKPVLDAYEREKTPLSLIRSPDTILHKDLTWLGCHLDAKAIHTDREIVVESKAFSVFNKSEWGEPGTDEVPLKIMWQTMAQMAVTGAASADVPITFVNEKVLAEFLARGTVPIEIYTIPRNEDLVEFLIAESRKVWDCVETKTLPEPVNVGDAEMIWRKSTKAVAEADDEIYAAYLELGQARAAMDAAEARKGIAEMKIKSFMKDAGELYFKGKKLATWNSNKDGTKFDLDAFKALHPELHKEFSTFKQGARPFLFKG